MGNADPLGKPEVCANNKPGQLSLAIGATQLTIAVHDPGVVVTAIGAGHDVNAGNWLSTTVTVNEQVDVNP